MQTPTYDNFQVAPNTLPQTRFSAQEMSDPGAGMMQQAKVSMALGQHYGEQALQQMMAANQSVADQKWVEVENYRLQLQQEYEQQRGLNALNREGGLSLADEYNNKLNQFIADQAESLNNRAQVEMFAHRVGPTQADFSDGVTKHMMAEGRKFQEETLKGRMDVTVSGAVVAPTDQAFATSIARLEQNIGDAAAYYGWAPEKAQMELRAKVGEVVSQRANRLMDLGDYQQAQTMVEQYGQMMDGKTALDVSARVSKFQLDDISAQQADQLYEAFKNNMSVDVAGVGGDGQSIVNTPADINRAVAKIIQNESGGNPNIPNKYSTAKGLGQFIDSTWLTMVKRYRPDIAAGKSNAQIIALKTNAPLAREMTARYVEENARALRSAGMPVTDGNLYLAHFLGAGGAIKLLSAQDKSQPVVNLVGQKVVDANRFIQGKSVQWVIDWTARKMGGGQQRAAAQRPGRLQKGGGVQAAGGGQSAEPVSRESLYAGYMRWIDENISNPVQREAVRRRFNERKEWDEKGANEELAKIKSWALDYVAANGTITGLPVGVQERLGPHEMRELQEYADKIRKGDEDRINEANELDYRDLRLYPEKMRSIGNGSEDDVKNYALPRFGPKRTEELVLKYRDYLQHGDASMPKLEQEMTLRAASMLGLNTSKTASPEDRRRFYLLQDNIINLQKVHHQMTGRYMTQAEWWEAIMKTSSDKIIEQHLVAGLDRSMLRGQLTPRMERVLGIDKPVQYETKEVAIPALLASPEEISKNTLRQGGK